MYYTVVTVLAYRVYSCFTLEVIVATAFGHQVNLQRGESDEFSKAMDTTMKEFASGHRESFILIHSMLKIYKWQSQIESIQILFVYFDTFLNKLLLSESILCIVDGVKVKKVIK